jgi:predicted amidophosphoribosyltransferase
MGVLEGLAGALAPPLCVACGRLCHEEGFLCGRCGRRLAALEPLRGTGPPGVDRCWSSAPHEGVARDLVVALKFRRLLPVAGLMAERVAWLAPGGLFGGAVVPVPTSPLRSLARGFDPAAELAIALAERTDMELCPCLGRGGFGRQVGRRRAERLGRPPRIRAPRSAPRSVVLVDDVVTTGATLSACARALRAAGAVRIVAVTFARRLGDGPPCPKIEAGVASGEDRRRQTCGSRFGGGTSRSTTSSGST